MVKSLLKKGGKVAAKKGVSFGDEKAKTAVKVGKGKAKGKKADADAGVVKRSKDKRRGVLYLGHIPHGYYEGQMRSFLSQYGKIKRLRLSRCKKTGASKGYGFVQFEDPDLAPAVAEEINNQYLTGKVIKADPMDPEKVHADMWKGMKVKTLIKRDQDIRINGPLVNYQSLTSKPLEKRIMDLVTKERAANAKLEALGIQYAFHGFEDQLSSLGIEYVPKATSKTTDSTATGKLASASKKTIPPPAEAAKQPKKKKVSTKKK